MAMEIWRKIVGLQDHFEVSSHGRVRHLLYYAQHTSRGGRKTLMLLPEKIYKQDVGKSGYSRVTCGGRRWFVHRLVASAFIENTEAKPQVNHKNGIKTDNRVENLEWATAQENRDHMIATGLQPYGSDFSKILVEEDVLKIRQLAATGKKHTKIAEIFNVTPNHVSLIVSRRSWKHI
jgi:hypothetical protein